jgi:hypothetical protein
MTLSCGQKSSYFLSSNDPRKEMGSQGTISLLVHVASDISQEYGCVLPRKLLEMQDLLSRHVMPEH